MGTVVCRCLGGVALEKPGARQRAMDGWTRTGEAPTGRAQAQQGAHDRGRIPEEPCEVETLMPGSAAEAGGAIPSPTVTGRAGSAPVFMSVVQPYVGGGSPPAAELGPLDL